MGEIRVTGLTADPQTVASQLGRAAGAHQKGHVPARLQKSASEISADRAGAYHERSHPSLSIVAPPSAGGALLKPHGDDSNGRQFFIVRMRRG